MCTGDLASFAPLGAILRAGDQNDLGAAFGSIAKGLEGRGPGWVLTCRGRGRSMGSGRSADAAGRAPKGCSKPANACAAR